MKANTTARLAALEVIHQRSKIQINKLLDIIELSLAKFAHERAGLIRSQITNASTVIPIVSRNAEVLNTFYAQFSINTVIYENEFAQTSVARLKKLEDQYSAHIDSPEHMNFLLSIEITEIIESANRQFLQNDYLCAQSSVCMAEKKAAALNPAYGAISNLNYLKPDYFVAAKNILKSALEAYTARKEVAKSSGTEIIRAALLKYNPNYTLDDITRADFESILFFYNDLMKYYWEKFDRPTSIESKRWSLPDDIKNEFISRISINHKSWWSRLNDILVNDHKDIEVKIPGSAQEYMREVFHRYKCQSPPKRNLDLFNEGSGIKEHVVSPLKYLFNTKSITGRITHVIDEPPISQTHPSTPLVCTFPHQNQVCIFYLLKQ